MPVTLQGSVTTLGARAKDSAPRVTGRVLVQGVSRIVESARGPWPVDTGASRASLGFVFNGKEVRIEAIYYAPYIVSHGVRPWESYLVVPLVRFIQYEGPQALGAAYIEALARTA